MVNLQTGSPLAPYFPFAVRHLMVIVFGPAPLKTGIYTHCCQENSHKKPAANGNGAGFHVRRESMWSLGVDTVRFWHNIMRPRQSGRHFAGDILKFVLQYVYCYIVIQVWLKCILMGPSTNYNLKQCWSSILAHIGNILISF